jgi:hypothetical protein
MEAMMEPVEMTKENVKYRVYECNGHYYIEGTNLDLLGIKRSSPPSFLNWTRDKYFPITSQQIEELKHTNGQYDYYPEFVWMQDSQINYIRTIEAARYVQGLPANKQEYINNMYSRIVNMDNKEFNKQYNMLVRAYGKYNYSDDYFEQEVGRTIEMAVKQKIVSPLFLEYLGNVGNLGHPEYIPDQSVR